MKTETYPTVSIHRNSSSAKRFKPWRVVYRQDQSGCTFTDHDELAHAEAALEGHPNAVIHRCVLI